MVNELYFLKSELFLLTAHFIDAVTALMREAEFVLGCYAEVFFVERFTDVTLGTFLSFWFHILSVSEVGWGSLSGLTFTGSVELLLTAQCWKFLDFF